ncbi:MAG: hypothetical protein AAF211_21560, partial [Myxococcota bacterium]
STTASQGSSRIVHTVSVRPDGLQIVQSLGEGTTRITIPVPRSTVTRGSSTPTFQTPGGPAAGGISAQTEIEEAEEIEGPVLVPLQGGQSAEIEANFSLKTSGVAVFEKATGIMTERIWLVQGVPTASAGGGGNRLGNYHTVGRVRLLNKDERVDVGPSMQVSVPTQTTDGLPDWKALETF